MLNNNYNGLFIDIEGLDGSGSSTQVGRVAKKLKEEGLYVYTTKEPTNNVIGGLIRGALTKVVQFPMTSLQLLFAADRGHHLQREIIPMLDNHSAVLTDRYIWSTVAFGSMDMDMDWLLELNKHFILPDITILLKVDPKICVRRIKRDRFDFELFEEEAKLKKIWAAYDKLSKRFANDIYVVEGERDVEEVTGEIMGVIRGNEKYKKLIE
jgi:dTMP kinase